MLLDSYLLPILEMAVSVAVPLVLTLKAVDAVLSSELSQQSKQLLLFWLNYWLVLFFIELSGFNPHFRTLFTLYYTSQHQFIPGFLIRFYRLNLIPFITKMLTKAVKSELTEADTDYYLAVLLKRVCFDANFLNSALSVFFKSGSPYSAAQTINLIHVTPEGSPRRHVETPPYPETLETHNPIELVKQRVAKRDSRTRPRSNSATNKPRSTSFSNTVPRVTTDPLPKAPTATTSNRTRQGESMRSDNDLLPYPQYDVRLLSPGKVIEKSFQFASDHTTFRDASDNVFDDLGKQDPLNTSDRRSFRSGIKNMFAGS